jgi:hypothetical protein
LKRACLLEGDNYEMKLSTADIAFSAGDYKECADHAWEILQSTKARKLHSQSAPIFVSALAVLSLEAVSQRNFGLAMDNLHRALFIAPEYGEDFICEALAPYFFALARFQDETLWHKLTDECQNLGFNKLLELLKLHDLVFRIRKNEAEEVEVKKLLLEKKSLFDEIKRLIFAEPTSPAQS